jgi:hypothetical protein
MAPTDRDCPMSSRAPMSESVPRPPWGTRGSDAACAALTWLHSWLARNLSQAARWLWLRQNRLSLALRFCVAAAGLALMAAAIAWFLPDRYAAWADFSPAHRRLLDVAGEWAHAQGLSIWAWGVAGLSMLAAAAAWWRRPASLWILKAAWTAFALLFAAGFRWMLVAPALLHNADYRNFDKLARNELWTWTFLSCSLAALWPLLMLVALLMFGSRRWYTGAATTRDFWGDRVIGSLRTGGHDPRLRSSTYWAAALTLIALVGPIILRGCGWEDPYGIVKGSGEIQVQMVKVKRTEKKQKQKKLTVNPWSPYILERMNIDDTKVLSELQEQTLDTYVADQTIGKLGKGGKGGGWPKGMEGANVRFIRLRYDGGDWDQDMGRGADYNLLIRFNQFTGLPIARETESREIERLPLFPKKRSPPFVFMTGRGNINISSREAKILREYCEREGGMMFIDNGGGHFGSSVRRMLSRVFPAKNLVDIANDDPIYQAPFVFPDGAPPFWHHDGNRALGIRHEGRWVVFYHPGDINDAWKDGHSGASPQVADQAYKLGVNIIYYAFNQYYRRHYEQD